MAAVAACTAHYVDGVAAAVVAGGGGVHTGAYALAACPRIRRWHLSPVAM